jgi:hypothetical protein
MQVGGTRWGNVCSVDILFAENKVRKGKTKAEFVARLFKQPPSDGAKTMRVTGRASYPRHPLRRGRWARGKPTLSYAVSFRSATELTLGDENGYAKHRSKIGANQA